MANPYKRTLGVLFLVLLIIAISALIGAVVIAMRTPDTPYYMMLASIAGPLYVAIGAGSLATVPGLLWLHAGAITWQMQQPR